jgi:hypothetical protein
MIIAVMQKGEPMKDLIDRQEAISLPVKPREDRYFQTQNLDDAYDYGWYSLQRCIEKLPSAQPKIIRCKDCKHYIPYDWMFSGLSRSSNINNYFPDDMVCLVNDDNYPPDGFCSKAERKNDDVD